MFYFFVQDHFFPDFAEIDLFFEVVSDEPDERKRERLFAEFLDDIRDPTTNEHDDAMEYFWNRAALYYLATEDDSLLNAVDQLTPSGGVWHARCAFFDTISQSQGYLAHYCGQSGDLAAPGHCADQGYFMYDRSPCPE